MKYGREIFRAFGALVAYTIVGSIAYSLPALKGEFLKHPNVYRPLEDISTVMPYGMAALVVAMLILNRIYKMAYREQLGLTTGARFGAMIGILEACTFAVHNYVEINIGVGVMTVLAVTGFSQWLAVGVAFGLGARPEVIDIDSHK